MTAHYMNGYGFRSMNIWMDCDLTLKGIYEWVCISNLTCASVPNITKSDPPRLITQFQFDKWIPVIDLILHVYEGIALSFSIFVEWHKIAHWPYYCSYVQKNPLSERDQRYRGWFLIFIYVWVNLMMRLLFIHDTFMKNIF